MQQEYSIVVTLAQVMPQGSQAAQSKRVLDKLLWVVKQVFIQYNHPIYYLPIIEQTSRVGRHQKINTGLWIGFAQGTQCWRGKQEIADASHLDDQDVCIG